MHTSAAQSWEQIQGNLTGAELLDQIETVGRNFIVFSSEHDRVAWVLFTAATHASRHGSGTHSQVCSVSTTVPFSRARWANRCRTR